MRANRVVPAVIVVLLLLTVIHYSTLGHWNAGYHYLTGTAKGCGFVACMEAARSTSARMRTAAEIRKNSRVLQREGGLAFVESPNGRWWTSAGSTSGLFVELAEQAHDVYGTEERGVSKGDVVLDCGANVGLFVRKALDRGAARIVAIEPVPTTVEALRRNFAAEIASGKVVVYPKGVWHQDDVLPMHVNPDHTGDSFVRELAGTTGVINLPLTTIDKIVAELGLERVDFIKMDIEGAERQAIRGASDTIRRFHPRMALCVYHMADDYIAVPAAVAMTGTSPYRTGTRCLNTLKGVFPEVYYFY